MNSLSIKTPSVYHIAMDNFLDLIIPTVAAQSADAVAQPTFGSLDGVSTPGALSTVLVSLDKTSAGIGDIITAQIEIKTNDIAISEYRIALDYDATKLTALDQDVTVAGTQSNLLDTIFLTPDPENQNKVIISGDIGRIFLKATVQTPGSAFQVNRKVLEVKFQAQATGDVKLKIAQGVDATQLIKSDGSTVSFTPNEVTLSILNAVSSSSSSDSSESSSSTISSISSSSSFSSLGPIVPVLPDTALGDGFGAILMLILAVLLIGTGISLKNGEKVEKRKHK
jgi:hypothetical protein